MTIWTSLDPAAVAVEPGSRATARLRVRNTGDTVEEYRLSLVGRPAGWGRVEPDVLRLYPGAEGTAEISFAPPRSPDAEAGPAAYGVRVEPRENGAVRDVVEGQLTIAPFTEIRAELLPPALTGRFRGKARVAVDNLGNTPVTASLVARDETDALEFDLAPNAVRVDPGRAAFADLGLRPRDIRWTGGEQSHRFTLALRRSGDDSGQELEGTFAQRPVVGAWLMTVGGLLVAGAVAFAVLWFGFSPKIGSSAKELMASGAPNPVQQGDGKNLPTPPPLPPGTGDDAGTGPGGVTPPPADGGNPDGGGNPPPTGNDGAGDGSGSGGSGGGTGGNQGGGPAQQPRTQVPAKVGPPWATGYQKDVVVEFAQERLVKLNNACSPKGAFTRGVIDETTRASLVCYQNAVDNSRKNPRLILAVDKPGTLGPATLTSLWMQGVTPDHVKRGDWDTSRFMAAFYWAMNGTFDAHDMDVARANAELGIDYFRNDVAGPGTSYNSNVQAHIRDYQKAMGLSVTGTIDWPTIRTMLGGGVIWRP
ncbi:hydrolase [Streptomyces sp. NPDC048659]|uniref:COG1470 family protein n=1 Tax=Streptomyces sp. NPDC048659 TaxID=3155489 RepID=UPI003415D852